MWSFCVYAFSGGCNCGIFASGGSGRLGSIPTISTPRHRQLITTSFRRPVRARQIPVQRVSPSTIRRWEFHRHRIPWAMPRRSVCGPIGTNSPALLPISIGAISVVTKNLVLPAQYKVSVEVWGNYVGGTTIADSGGTNGTTVPTIGIGAGRHLVRFCDHQFRSRGVLVDALAIPRPRGHLSRLH